MNLRFRCGTASMVAFFTTVFIICVTLSATAVSAQETTRQATPAVTSTAVTTTGGTANYLPKFSGSSSVVNSLIYDNGSNVGIGIIPNGNAKLDLNGSMILRGIMTVARTGNASAAKAYPSNGFDFYSQAYNSSSRAIVNPFFQIESEPTGNNTASPGATLNFLYSPNGTAAETGLYINSNGTIHFASAQTFPATANGISSVNHDSSLTGNGNTTPLGIASVGHDSNFTGSGTSASPLSLATTLNVTAVNASQNMTAINTSTFGAAFSGTDNSGTGIGVRGTSTAAGGNDSGYGGIFEGDIGVFGSGNAYAGYFSGNVYVSGTLAKAGGSFKIDDPIDPENKYLSHSFVESPDMMNIYNGNITTDSKGEAIVTMPEYFESLNRDFRYQLTVMGQFAQAIVGSKITGNVFIIKTDKPNVEVSWQVTGVRQDAWANAHRIPNEEEKPQKERGHYLHPELFGHIGEAAIGQPIMSRPQ